jgi:phosphoglycerate dehydrogenase-like enzyme
VVLALALTPGTTGILDRRRLELLAPGAWVVNVARGAHIVTEDLVAVLREGRIGGAALDVTDPEPLPEGHPLWSEPRCVITPHTANTPEMAVPLLTERVRENVRRRIAGEPLLGAVDPQLGY